MSAHHDHHDHHHHHHDTPGGLSFNEKMIKLLEHWIQHNDDHRVTYSDWAQKAKDNGLPEAAADIEEAARMTLEINRLFDRAAKTVKAHRE